MIRNYENAPSTAMQLLGNPIAWMFATFLVVGVAYIWMDNVTQDVDPDPVRKLSPENASTTFVLSEEAVKQESLAITSETDDTRAQEFLAIEEVENAIEPLFRAAEENLDLGNYVTPDGQSAWDNYQKILSLSPDDTKAQAGLTRIRNLLIDNAEASLETSDLAEAEKWLTQLDLVEPEGSIQADMRKEIKQIIEREAARKLAAQQQQEKANTIKKALAQAAEEETREPINHNKIKDLYNRVLEIDPEESRALLGIQNLVDNILDQGEAALRNDDLEAAAGFLDQAGSIDNESKRLGSIRLALESRVSQKQAEEAAAATAALEQEQQTGIEQEESRAQSEIQNLVDSLLDQGEAALRNDDLEASAMLLDQAEYLDSENKRLGSIRLALETRVTQKLAEDTAAVAAAIEEEQQQADKEQEESRVLQETQELLGSLLDQGETALRNDDLEAATRFLDQAESIDSENKRLGSIRLALQTRIDQKQAEDAAAVAAALEKEQQQIDEEQAESRALVETQNRMNSLLDQGEAALRYDDLEASARFLDQAEAIDSENKRLGSIRLALENRIEQKRAENAAAIATAALESEQHQYDLEPVDAIDEIVASLDETVDEPEPATKTTVVEEVSAEEARQRSMNEQVERGIQAYYDGDYNSSFELLYPMAEEGIARAQFRIGVMYRYGRSVAKNSDLSEAWFTRALPSILKFAQRGTAWAQTDLGTAYELGISLNQDFKRAAHWYKQAAEQGYAGAQTNLGVLYATGEGVDYSRSEAVYWLKQAANQGDLVAIENLKRLGVTL